MNNLHFSQPGLYIHIPFCKTICPYCDFYSIKSLNRVGDFVESLKNELILYKDFFDSFTTLFIGGGTPSVLSSNHLESIIVHIFNNYKFHKSSEITIELNPDDINEEKLKLLYNLGINRFSVGVQSFNDNELVLLKRRHSAFQAKHGLELINKAGIENYGIDLIWGLPGQSLNAWQNTLDTAMNFHPKHISCYQLTFEHGTELYDLKQRGLIKQFSEKKAEDFYFYTSKYLKAHGYIHYEISNFAMNGYWCNHNLKYWNHSPYIGLGPSAHSFKDKKRWWNYKSVTKYCNAVKKRNLPVEGYEYLSKEQFELEEIYLGFRTQNGVDLSLLKKYSNANKVINGFLEKEFVIINNERVQPTVKGFILADSLTKAFL